MESDEKNLGELYGALAAFQGQFENPEKKSENPFFKSKYADLSGIWESVRGTLTKNGLAFIQMPTANEGVVEVRGIIAHKSGQTISSVLTLRPKDMTPQSIGSALSYARRYQMCAMLGIAPEAEDDDGQAAQGKPTEKTTLVEKPKEKPPVVLSPLAIIHDYEERAKKKNLETFVELQGVIGKFCGDVAGKDFSDLNESELVECVKAIETHYKNKKAGK